MVTEYRGPMRGGIETDPEQFDPDKKNHCRGILAVIKIVKNMEVDNIEWMVGRAKEELVILVNAHYILEEMKVR